MISYQYAKCLACHESPQGRELLTEYGSGIDLAQSMVAGNYHKSKNKVVNFFNANGKINHDIRALFKYSKDFTAKTNSDLVKVHYRNLVKATSKLRLGFTAGADDTETKAKGVGKFGYTQNGRKSKTYLRRAMIEYRLPQEESQNGFEISLGRDYLPTGYNHSDHTAFTRARNRMSAIDYPTQLKAIGWGQTHLYSLFLIAPSGEELSGHRETGLGALYEKSLNENKLVLGVTGIYGTSDDIKRQMIGAYSRWGISRAYGLFFESIYTNRELQTGSKDSFGQWANFIKLYAHAQEWLVPSITLEHLNVSKPYNENIFRATLGLGARLSRNLSIGVSYRKGGSSEETKDNESFVFKLFLKS